jgi:hypothetical protein
VPSLGRIFDRRPAYTLSTRYSETRIIDKIKASLKQISNSIGEGDENGNGLKSPRRQEPLSLLRTKFAKITPSDLQYAVLPDGEKLHGWTREEKEEMDDIVRHMLHSRRARIKRSMKGFWQYVRRREFTLNLF